VTRSIYEKQDLSGRKFSDIRESLFVNCNLTDTTFTGACEGADYIGCDCTRANWSGADTYASYWRNCNLTDAQFPSTLGHTLHHEPISEILRRGIAASPTKFQPKIQEVYEYLFNTSRVTASWHPSKTIWWDEVSSVDRKALHNTFQEIFAPYPLIAAKHAKVVKKLELGEELPVQAQPTSITIEFPDGVKVALDALNLPKLKDISRHTLSRWVESQADGQNDNRHYIFIMSMLPPMFQVLLDPDEWLKSRRSAF
jgi:hypothetical protein